MEPAYCDYPVEQVQMKNGRSRIVKGRRTRKLRWVECERLKEIVPSIAKSKRVNEVKIIKEAIKHISRLEEAVLQRLVASNSETAPDISGKRISDILPREVLLTIAAQANVHMPNLTRDPAFLMMPSASPPKATATLTYAPGANSTASSPCWTDEDYDLERASVLSR